MYEENQWESKKMQWPETVVAVPRGQWPSDHYSIGHHKLKGEPN
uniref:Uncharacterized protein n=1 Tax=Lepeophtheirus salmonis TaxID=72036 RepID=A0A0K2V333_LEPSM